MDVNTIADTRKEVHVCLREEIACTLVENKCLVTTIAFVQPDDGAPLDCSAEIHFEGLDPAARMRRAVPAIDSPEMMDYRAALRALLNSQLLAALATAEKQFSGLTLVCVDGPPANATPAPRMPPPRPGFLPQRPAGEPSKHGYLGAIVSSSGANRPAGGYLPPRGYLPATPARSAPAPATAAPPPAPMDTVTVRTNYTAIEQTAGRILHLKEAIRGLTNDHL